MTLSRNKAYHDFQNILCRSRAKMDRCLRHVAVVEKGIELTETQRAMTNESSLVSLRRLLSSAQYMKNSEAVYSQISDS